ncbi:Bax inhibitor-1 family protein [Trifolium repens]|nr:Bax inhibitor-1 family protein [Trifolium repens]
MSVIVEIGENPVMHDIHQERISSILKLYSIVTFQLLLTIVVVFVPPVVNFLNNSRHEGVLDIVTLFAFCLLCYYNKKHPLCYFFLLSFTVAIALFVGLKCALIGGN